MEKGRNGSFLRDFLIHFTQISSGGGGGKKGKKGKNLLRYFPFLATVRRSGAGVTWNTSFI